MNCSALQRQLSLFALVYGASSQYDVRDVASITTLVPFAPLSSAKFRSVES
eukprot:m.478992 g.478992  ORF g.478992 m.478992 type:complete len:51 (+) comp48052_c0_seq1:974-1126(+)